MGKRIDPEERARRLQKKGFNPDKGSLSRERVWSELQPGTEYNYASARDLWLEYRQSNGAKDSDIFNQETLKHFIIYMAAGVEGRDDGKPMDSYILKIWKAFTAEWRRRTGIELPEAVINSGVHVSGLQPPSPRHPIQEDISPLPLYLNPVLEPLAIYLARGLFRDYKTADEIFAINPPPDSPCIELVLRNPTTHEESCTGKESSEINSKYPKKQKLPFYESVTARGLTGKTLKSNWLSGQLSLLGRRSGYDSLTMHDIRAEALMVANASGYSQADIMKFAGQGDPKVYRESYMSKFCRVDGVSNILNLPRRHNIHEHLRGLSLRRNPTLQQALPAQLEHDLKKCPEYVEINSKIEDISERIKTTPPGEHQRELQNERRAFYSQRSKLLDQELDKWQKQQILDCKHGTKDEGPSALSYLESFERISHLMPERKRLSKLLFMPVPLRSLEGRQAIKDMVTLCQKGRAVSDHPALMPENGRCPVTECPDGGSLPSRYKWRHIYTCLRSQLTVQHGFTELCFICNEWVTGWGAFEGHYQHHLDHPDTIPIQYNYLEVQGILASPAYCPRCLGNETMVATERLYAFMSKQSFANHMRNHYKKFEGQNPLGCGSLHCPGVVFNSVFNLQCHYHDVHSIPMPIANVCHKRKRESHKTTTCFAEQEFSCITPEIFELESTLSPRKRRRSRSRSITTSSA
ncbi:hypothetical protein MauCBS54593_005303 [Microsporum audouinii]